MPEISVIVPVYNVREYISECCDSIFNQTYQNFEFIIVDDCSTDNSLSIIESYTDDRIKVIHKENGGLSDARNAGLDACEGDYVYFLDSDDYIDSNALFLLIDIAEKEKSDSAEAFSAKADADARAEEVLAAMDPEARAVFEAIPESGDCALESLCHEELPLRTVMKYLLKLEIKGLITMLPGERVQRADAL